MWVGGAAAAEALPPRQGKVVSVASLSSVGLVEGASVALTMATRSVHVVSLSDAFAVVALVTGRGSVVLALQLLAITCRQLAIALRSLVLLTS